MSGLMSRKAGGCHASERKLCDRQVLADSVCRHGVAGSGPSQALTDAGQPMDKVRGAMHLHPASPTSIWLRLLRSFGPGLRLAREFIPDTLSWDPEFS